MEPSVYTSRLKVLLWTGIARFFLCSCGAERTCEPDRGSTSLEYFPLAIGNNWTYHRGSSADSFWIDTAWSHGDTAIFLKSGRAIGGAWYFSSRYAIYPDGSIWAGRVSETGFEYSMMLPSWPAVGHQWIMFDQDMVRIATDTTVVVPAGTFDCLEVVRWRQAMPPDDAGTYSESYYTLCPCFHLYL